MAISFSPAEQDVINKQKLPDDSLPKYYNTNPLSPETSQFTRISRDFEAYLILQPSSQKQTVQGWIKAVKTFNVANTDRDIILAAYLNIRATDVALRLNQLDSSLSNFADFKASLTTGNGTDPSKYADILELDLLSKSLQRPIEETVVAREQAFHENNMVLLLSKKLAFTKADTSINTELTAWQAVMGTYAGQDI
jgi:hypothetical protein